jgi:hypothetical protein
MPPVADGIQYRRFSVANDKAASLHMRQMRLHSKATTYGSSSLAAAAQIPTKVEAFRTWGGETVKLNPRQPHPIRRYDPSPEDRAWVATALRLARAGQN